MKIQVNLASRPFVELRPFFLRLRIIMAVLAVVALGVAIGSHFAQKKLQAAERQMNILQQRTAAAQSEKQTNERRMRQPANAGVLERAHFLNALFLRKSFSWTAVLMDLETVLPAGVQVTSLEPQITAAAESNVAIRLRVSGDRDKAVMLVRNLERSKRFLVPRLISETTQAKDKTLVLANGAPPAVEFEILADYNPLPEGEPFDKKAEEKTASDARKVTAKTPSTKTPSTKPPAAKPNGKFPKDGVVLKPFVPKGGAR